MKKGISIILLMVFVLSFSACKPQEPAATYQDVLAGTATFVTEKNKKASLASFELEKDGKKWNFEARNYLLTDLNGDKSEEMIINEKENMFKLILHTQNGKIYGILIDTNKMLNLKTDATFKQVPDEVGGFTKICSFKSFNKTSYELNELAKYSIKESEFYIDGKESYQVLTNKFFKEFSEKENQKNYVKVK